MIYYWYYYLCIGIIFSWTVPFPVEVSSGSSTHSQGVTLGERDVCVGVIYGAVSICVLRHPSTPTIAAHLDVYSQNKYVLYYLWLFALNKV